MKPATIKAGKDVLLADIYDVVKKTELQRAKKLSKQLNADVYIKREDNQPVHSFKIRGAYNKIKQLSRAQREAGVIAASAGNHAQGVAFSAQKLGISAVIVMPRTTPSIKVEAVASYGAEIVLHGDNYSEAAERCAELIEERGMTYVAPFDDADVIAGQGTLGKELLEDLPELDVVFVAVGGGGLISGVGAYIKSVKPEVKVIGVEPEDSACMSASIKAGKPVELDSVGIFADGVAVKKPGDLTFEVAQDVVDEFITVDTDNVCAAIKDIFEDTRVLVEPAGALSVAAAKKYAQEHDVEGMNVATINCGANMSFERLRFVAERTLAGSGKESFYGVEMPEQPGSLSRFCNEAVGDRSITEFSYRSSEGKKAHVFVGIEIAGDEDKADLESNMASTGFKAVDLTHDELAKEHVRYMIGGQASGVKTERIFRIDFPERPGALTDFLAAMGDRWNITLFHYRAIGGDLGRVLVGFDLGDNHKDELIERIVSINYPFIDVTDDTAYQVFLR